MKKLLFVCLLGLGMLLPSTTVTAKESVKHRIVDIGLEGYVLTANSEKEDGTIDLIEVRKLPDGKLMASEGCNDYTCSVDISGLPSGSYVVKVFATYTTYEMQFKK